jgi:hypothetical protein
VTTGATDRTWGFHLVVLLPANRRLSGETRQTWSLPEPVGEVELAVAGATLQEAGDLTFRGSGYASEEDAQAAGELFRDWLRVASALFVLGFDVGSDLPPSWLGDEAKAAFEAKLHQKRKFLVSGVQRLLVYEEQARPVRVIARADGIIVQQSSTVLENVLSVASESALTDEQSLACDLVSLAEHEVSERAGAFPDPRDCHGGPRGASGTGWRAPRPCRALHRGSETLKDGSGIGRSGSILIAAHRA